MKKRIGLLLSALVVISVFQPISHAISNPLKDYDLYADTHPDTKVSKKSNDTKASSKSKSSNTTQRKSGYTIPQKTPDFEDIYSKANTDFSSSSERRNDYLRNSSRDVFADSSVPAGWTEGPSFYENPTLDSIKEKYHLSNFAGCLQESISYVRQNPYDTIGFYYLAMSYAKTGDRENAIKAYEKVISLQDTPMIVKYATNGRNCVMEAGKAKCYPHVNEPELLYPYADIAATQDLTPIDPETLIIENLEVLEKKLAAEQKVQDSKDKSDKKGAKAPKVNLPFGEQDDKLDEFIKKPYGSGLSEDLEKQYTQTQLRKLQQNINNKDIKTDDNLKNIKKFDNHKTDSGEIKLAYVSQSEFENLKNNPDFIQSQKEIDEINILLGNGSSSKKNSDITDIIPYITNSNEKVSPELVQMMVMQSVMPDYNLIDNNDK